MPRPNVILATFYRYSGWSILERRLGKLRQLRELREIEQIRHTQHSHRQYRHTFGELEKS
jgi:hypothetical protein